MGDLRQEFAEQRVGGSYPGHVNAVEQGVHLGGLGYAAINLHGFVAGGRKCPLLVTGSGVDLRFGCKLRQRNQAIDAAIGKIKLRCRFQRSISLHRSVINGHTGVAEAAVPHAELITRQLRGNCREGGCIR
ncbi:hypothetical protein D3C79_542700 [compost metagenome]